MKKFSLLITCMLSVLMLQAQTAADALRFSSFDVSGTARTIGVGGGLSALGADFSVVSTNPAGLARFRTSEFTFSPSIYTSSTGSILENGGTSENNESKTKFALSNIGYVTSAKPMNAGNSKWKTANISIGMNQLANFNRTFFYSGTTEGSYSDRFLELAIDENGDNILPDELGQFEAGLAFSTGAIYDGSPTVPGDQWKNDFQDSRGVEVYKEQIVNTSGTINELSFALAGNYDEKLMIGGAVALPFVKFSEEKTYVEEDPNDDIPNFEEMTFEEELSISGVGLNFKFGMIYRFSQTLHLGAAVHSPTRYNLTDNFSNSLNYIFDLELGGGPESYTEDSPEGTFDYKLASPWRYIGSAGVIIKKKGFLTIDVEYLDYGKTNFNLTANSSDPGDAAYQDDLNQEISEGFTSALNVKVGGEYAYNMFRFRAGYGIYGTPYAEDTVVNNAISLGLGLRKDRFYTDLAYRKNLIDEGYIPYKLADSSNEQLVSNSFNNNRIVLTFGFKF